MGGASTLTETPEYYGAVAYDIEKRVFAADKGASPTAALAAVEQECRNQGGGNSCQALSWFTNCRASLALAPLGRYLPNDQPERIWGLGFDSLDLTKAGQIALKYCNEVSAEDEKTMLG